MKFILIIVIVCVAAYTSATAVRKCANNENGINYDDLSDRVYLQNCTKPPCVIRRDSFLKVEMKFTPDQDVKGVKNSVTAEILSAKLPFPGVDGQSACPHIYEEDKKTKVKDCELKAGKDYYFSDGFEVLRIYPRIKTVVRWAITGSNKKNLICFETNVRITD